MKSKTDNSGGPLRSQNGGLAHHKIVDLEAYEIAKRQYLTFQLLDKGGAFEDLYEGILKLVQRHRDEESKTENRVRNKEAKARRKSKVVFNRSKIKVPKR